MAMARHGFRLFFACTVLGASLVLFIPPFMPKPARLPP